MTTANSPESNFNKLEGLKGDQSLDKKLQNLVKQIDELRDTDSGNDAIDGVFDKKIGGVFDKGLSKALNKCDIFVIDNLLAAIKEVKASISTDSEEGNSLTRLENGLTRLKENREKTQESTFKRFDEWVKVLASGVAENPHRKKDEISAVVDFVKNDAHNADALNLYYQIKNDIPWSEMASSFDKKTFDTVGKIMREVTHSIENKIHNDDFLKSLTIDTVKEAKLDEVFGDGNVGNLVTLLNNYLSIKNWNGENLNSDSGTWNSNGVVFSHEDFIKRFNEINTERKKDIDESIKGITIDDIDDDEMRKFLVLVGENKADKTLYYDKEEFTVSKMQEVFPDKVDGIISKGVDAEREGLLNEVFKKVSELVNYHIEKRENDEYIDINTWEMKLGSEDYKKMEAALGADKMFLKHEYRTEGEKHVDRYSYNLKKLQSFLDGVKDSNFSGLMKLSQSKNENDVYTARAAISAIQILLNREFPKNLLVVDGKYRDGGSTYNRTLDFQKKYNEGKDKSVQLRLDGKPGIKTITALLGGEVTSVSEKPVDASGDVVDKKENDDRIDNSGNINVGGNNFNVLNENGKQIIVGEGGEKFTGYEDNMSGLGFKLEKNGLYLGNFVNGKFDGEGKYCFNGGNQISGKWEDGIFQGGKFSVKRNSGTLEYDLSKDDKGYVITTDGDMQGKRVRVEEGKFEEAEMVSA